MIFTVFPDWQTSQGEKREVEGVKELAKKLEHLKCPNLGDKKESPQLFFGTFKAGATEKKAVWIEEMHALAVDVDGLPPDAIADLENALGALAYAVHTTYRHTDKLNRCRYILPLAKPFLPAKSKHKWSDLYRSFLESLPVKADEQGAALSKAWAAPSAPDDSIVIEYHEGELLDIEAFTPRPKPPPVAPPGAFTRDDLGKIINRYRNRQHKPLLSALRALRSGEAFAEESERNATAWDLAVLLAREAGPISVEDVIAVFDTSLAVTGEPTPPVFADMIKRSAGAQTAAEAERTDEDIVRYIRAYWNGLRGTPWTDDEWEADRPLFLQGTGNRGTLYWSPLGYDELPPRAEERHLQALAAAAAAPPCLGIELHTADAKGQPRLKNIKELLAHSVTFAKEHWRFESVSHVNKKERIFYRGCVEPHGLRCTRSERVETWFEALAGGEVERLKTWLAALRCHDKALTALCIVGAPGIGKSLLGASLPRLWGPRARAATPDDLFERFNVRVARCPLVLFEEQLPARHGGRPISHVLRDKISAPSHPVEEKHKAKVELEGYVRILVNANNYGSLHFGMGSEADSAAVLERFCVLHADDAAAKAAVDRLVAQSDDPTREVAEHVLWLEGHHQWESQGRFILAPKPNEALSQAEIRQGLRSELCQWVARHIQDGSSHPLKGGHDVWDGKHVWVSVSLLYDKWDSRDTNHRDRPDAPDIRSALGYLSDKETIRDGVELYRISWATLRVWLQVSGYATIESLRQTVREGRKDV